MSESFLPASNVTATSALRLRAFATRLALRGRSVTFRYWDEGVGAMASRTAQTVLVTFDAETARQADSEITAAAWTDGLIEKEGTLVIAAGDVFLLDGYAATVTAVLPPDRGIERARFTLSVGVAGAG